MRAQISVEYLVMTTVFLTIFSFVLSPLSENSIMHTSDVSDISMCRNLLFTLRSESILTSVSGNRTLDLNSPCSFLNCSGGVVECTIELRSDPLGKKTYSYSVSIPGISINGIDCAITGGTISSDRGYLRVVLS